MNKLQSAYYSAQEVAEKLNLSERFIRETINKGTLPAYKIFTKWYIGHEDLQKFIFDNATPSTEVLSNRGK